MRQGFHDRIDEFGPGDDDDFLTTMQWSHEHGGFEIPVHNLPPGLELSAPFERVQVLHTGGAEEAWITPRLDLAVLGLRRRLGMPPYAPLVIEKIGGHLVSVAHYCCQNGDAIADPNVAFFTGYGPWVPLEITLPPVGGCRVCQGLP